MSDPTPPTTQTVAASAARQRWSQLLNQVFRHEIRVIVEKSGVPVAALVSADDLARLELLDHERAERFRALDASWKAFEGVPAAEIEQEVARAVEEARARRRLEPPTTGPTT